MLLDNKYLWVLIRNCSKKYFRFNLVATTVLSLQ